jgi:hypothetical protein
LTSYVALKFKRTQTVSDSHDQEPKGVTETDVTHGIEKFTAGDLATLRSDLLQSGVDSFQAADLVATFLNGRGYGISTDEARGVASKIEGVGSTVESIQAELERVAHFA